MSLVAPVKDGKIQQTSSASSLANKNSTSSTNSAADKDTFLQMLVAEMKYQDPLEPTSNTEWVSQYATFSELEQMQNMAESTEASRANDLVGKTVIMKVKDGSGDTTQVQGRVDYVVYEGKEAYLSIDESLYSISDLYMTVDDTYLDAYDKALEFSTRLGKLPDVNDITLQDKDEIEYLHKMYYDDMNDYQKSFVASDSKKLLDKYYEQLQNVIEAAKDNETEEGAEGTGTDEDKKDDVSENTLDELTKDSDEV